MKHNTPKQPSQRQLRAGELLKHIIAETLQRGHFHDDALQNTAAITVIEVRCAPDLKNATAYVMALGGKDMDIIIPALNAHAKEFQRDIAQNSNLKFTPRIVFKADDVFENASRIEGLLRDL